MMRSVSADFVLAMEEKLEWGRSQGRTGWDSHWENISIDGFNIQGLLNKLEEEIFELGDETHKLGCDACEIDLKALRLEAADVANVAMMIADMAGALADVRGRPKPPEGEEHEK